MTAHMLRMAAMGLLVSVVAPLILMALLRFFPRLERYTLPAGVVWPAFVLLHFAVTMLGVREESGMLDRVAHLVLLCGAVLFWVPVCGYRRRLSNPGRTLYLYVGMPMLDVAGVWLAATGDLVGGLSMIVGMLPMGLTAAGVTWLWITREERRAELHDPPAPGAGEAAVVESRVGGDTRGGH